MSEDLIDDPTKGIRFVNKHIRKLEEMIEKFEKEGNLADAAKCEWHLTKWADILQHYVRESHQEGLRTRDFTQLGEGVKVRKSRSQPDEHQAGD